jgi:hypothetical protein
MQASHPAVRIALRSARSPREVGCKVVQSSLLPVSAHSSPECLTCPLGVSASQAPSREVGTRACARPALRSSPAICALLLRPVIFMSTRRRFRPSSMPRAFLLGRDPLRHGRFSRAWSAGTSCPTARISSSRANASRANALPWCSRMRSRREFCRNLLQEERARLEGC